ncbi:hypothetical protein EI94DRAFT_1735866 [Lactarius quietus]|nr:hypothetical protein EI94DRAFT_1735866 [Lactarius quietus]
MRSVNVNHRSDGDEGGEGEGRANDNELVKHARLMAGISSAMFFYPKYPSTAQELAVIHLLDPDAPLGMDVPLAQCPPFDSCILAPSGLQGMHQECLNIMQLLVLFSFIWMGVLYPCALVQWFTYIADKPDEAMGLWVVQPDYNADGSPAIGVIHLDLVLPFYVTKYIDYHAFEITS